MRLQASRSVLLIVDMQTGLMPAISEGDVQITTVERLAKAALLLRVPVFATEHVPEKIGHTVGTLRPYVQTVFTKRSFDATAQPGFNGFLPVARPQVLVVGAEAHVCVMQTALGLLDQGFEVWMVVDGCGSRYLADKSIAMNRLQTSGARLSSAEATLFEWLGSADHPQFRAVLNLIKSRDSLA